MVIKRIGILTGGGDVPGLNAVIKSVTNRGSENDIEVVGLRRGWEALTHLNLEDPTSTSHYLIQLNRDNTRTIDRRGGTVLHSSRTNPSKMQKLPDHLSGKDFPVSGSIKGDIAAKKWDLTSQVLANLSGLGIEHLIAIGGDDTLSYAAKLNELGVRIIAVRRMTRGRAETPRAPALAPAPSQALPSDHGRDQDSRAPARRLLG
jgi:ATP-dependent phosphofructokinase / diphosphate-dependent phosphofructokinase